MFKNVYIRCPLLDGDKLRGPLESLIYSLTPNDELLSAERIAQLVEAHARQDPDIGPLNTKTILQTIKDLASRGPLQEVHGLRIEKCVREAANMRPSLRKV